VPASHAIKVALTPQLARFVDDLVAGGAYDDASEVVRDALRELQRRKHDDQLTEIRSRIGAALDQIDRGEGRSGDPPGIVAGIFEEARRRHHGR